MDLAFLVMDFLWATVYLCLLIPCTEASGKFQIVANDHIAIQL